ncbi:SAGA complex subunit spt20 [Vanrija pseudolonga]|uniref:SAGA complex subunit spt20 n=1 Tax=Vanrija pseudolonga TaxID=143232 RepID=A0AAF0YEY4_9TREE|nr:SAGA complex subunit spt20 [Vanrija pseudolonga]
MASASGYNYHRFARAVLKKARKWEPSLTIQLYPTYWRFEHSQINFLYDGPMKPFLMALRAQVIPASLIPFLYDIRPPVSFVDGCLVIEVQDYRKNPEVRSRVVMRPAPETLPQTIDAMLERRRETWDDQMTLELESRILAATSAPLYLGTSLLASRNAALSLALTAPAGPNLAADGNFRPTLVSGADEDSEQETIRKLLGAGTRSSGGAFQPSWSVLRLMERIKGHNKQKEADAAARRAAAAATGNKPGAPPGPPLPGQGPEVEKKPPKKKKRPAQDDAGTEEKKPAKKKKALAAAAAAAAAPEEPAPATTTGGKKKVAPKKDAAKAKEAKEAEAKAKEATKDAAKDKGKDKDKEKEKEKDGDKEAEAAPKKKKKKPTAAEKKAEGK